MKKIVLSILALISACLCSAQVYPTTQRSMLTEWGTHTCGPCYSWAWPMVNYFKGIYGDNLIYFKHEHGGSPTVLSREISRWLLEDVYITAFGVSMPTPSMFVNQQYLSHATGDSVFKAAVKHVVDSTNSYSAWPRRYLR